MKSSKLSIATIAALVLHLTLTAQQQPCVGFLSWIREPVEALGETNEQALQTKIDQIIARNNMGATTAMDMFFAVYPSFVVTGSDVIETGMKPVTVVRGELTLFAVNRADMSNYGMVAVSLEANADTEQQAVRKMIAGVRATDQVFARFLKSAQQKIVDYYGRMTPKIVTKANAFAAQNNYDDALALLAMIPECVDNYDQITALMVDIYTKYAEYDADLAIREGKSQFAIHNFEAAVDALLRVEPTSSRAREAYDIIDQIALKVNDDQRRELETQWKIYDDRKAMFMMIYNDQLALERLRIDSSKRRCQKELKVRIDNHADGNNSNPSQGNDDAMRAWYVQEFQ